MIPLRFIFFIACFLTTTSYIATPIPTSMKRVSKSLDDFVDNLNRHDLNRMLANWNETGDMLAPWGQLANGKANVEKLFASIQNENYRKLKVKHSVNHIRFFTLDVAFVDSTAILDNSALTTEEKDALKLPLNYHIVWFLERLNDKWIIDSLRPYTLLGDIKYFHRPKILIKSLPYSQQTS